MEYEIRRLQRHLERQEAEVARWRGMLDHSGFAKNAGWRLAAAEAEVERLEGRLRELLDDETDRGAVA